MAGCASVVSDVDPALRDRAVSLTPAAPNAASTLVASYATHPDDIRVRWKWYVNDIPVRESSDPTFEGAFSKGQRVRVNAEVVTKKGPARGESAPVVIGNLAPQPGAVGIEPLVARAWGSDLVCVPFGRAVDDDEDELSWTMSWQVDGVAYDGPTKVSTWPGDTVSADQLRPQQVWTCLASVSDGTAEVAAAPVTRSVGTGLPPLIGQPVAGRRHTCLLDEARRPYCWGRDADLGESTPPSSGTYNRLFTGLAMTCGLRAEDLGLSCWGTDNRFLMTPPEAAFVDVAIGLDHACGITDQGALLCWGNPVGVQPEGVFRAVAAGSNMACAVDVEGRATCWGSNLPGGLPDPDEVFVDVAVGTQHGCGLTTSGAVSCWGSNGYGEATPPSGRFAALGARAAQTCGLRPSGEVTCWGDVDLDFDLRAQTLSLQLGLHLCVSDVDGQAVCVRTLGDDGLEGAYGEERVPDERFAQLDVGRGIVCGLDRAGVVDCIGVTARIGMPTEPLSQVAAGTSVACGLRQSDAHAVCWGYIDESGLDAAPDVALHSVSVGLDWACGLTEADGQIVCWGDVVGSVPEGSWSSVHVADTYACALDDLGIATCFGTPDVRRAPSEQGFAQIDVDVDTACGLHASGSVSCWGRVRVPETRSGPFTDVSVSTFGVCARTPAKELVCWGTGRDGPAVPNFTLPKVIAHDGGGDWRCALDEDEGLWCWGELRRSPRP